MPTYARYSGVGGGGIQSINNSTVPAQQIVAGTGISVGTVVGTGITTITNTSPMAATGNLTEATSAVLTISGGTGCVIGAGTTIQVLQSSALQSGYLSSGDWSTFNNKVSSVGASAPISSTGGTTPSISISQSSALTDGYLSSTDWNTFNNKQNALSFGNLTGDTNANISISGGTGAVIGAGASVSQSAANATTNGYLTSSDWSTFNAKANSTLSNLTSPTAINQNLNLGSNAISQTNYIISPQLYDAGIKTGNFTLDWANGPTQKFIINAAGPLVVTLNNPVTGGSYLLRIEQGATPGTLTWPVNVDWGNAGSPTLSTATGDVDLVSFWYDGATYYASAQIEDNLAAANINLSNLVAPTAVNVPLLGTLGVVGAPAYSFTGDTNTGLWSSGADTLNLSTNGVERLRIASTGETRFVGSTSGSVGVQSPATVSVPYTVTLPNAQGAASSVLQNDGSGNLSWVVANLPSQSASTNGKFLVSDGTNASWDSVVNEAGLSTVDFRVEGDTDANLLFTDASADNVGIGTNSPGAKLDVRGSVIINEAGGDNDVRIEGDTDANLLFTDASTDRVGVGTNTPSTKLDVVGSIKSSADIQAASYNSGQLAGTRNRIINGAMQIDQRNAGASVTLTSGGVYPVDRWLAAEDTDGAMTAEQVEDAPAGFYQSIKFQTTTADASLGATQYVATYQKIEGNNLNDLNWGTASAKQITLSFWVKSSLTGTFGGALENGAQNRAYPFTYTINAANTWEQKSVTISGDTTGTWLQDNGIGAFVLFGLGVGSTYSGTAGAWAAAQYFSATGATSVIGTLNANWFITGVQFEVGPVATSFEWRNYQQELAMCQRYYYRISDSVANRIWGMGQASGTTNGYALIQYPVTMRVRPTALESSAANTWSALNSTSGGITLTTFTFNVNTTNANAIVEFTVTSGLTAGNATSILSTTTAYAAWSAEL